MDESTTSSDTYKISNYNTAGFINMRLNELWISANKNSRRGDFHGWNFDLDAIFRELTRDFKPDAEEDKEFKKINDELKELFPLARPTVQSFNKEEGITYETRIKQYEVLHKKDIFLKRLENQVGKGSSYHDEFEDDF